MAAVTEESEITFLSVGTRILAKDVMDQYIRSLGNHRTHYAPNAGNALRILNENKVDVLILEFDLGDTTAFQFLKQQRLDPHFLDTHCAMVLEADERPLRLIAQELDIKTLLIKPFSARTIKKMIDSYREWKRMPKSEPGWIIHVARLAFLEKRLTDAEKFYRLGLQYHPENVQVLQKAGAFFLQKPDLAEAEKLLTRALQLDPYFIPTLSTMGALKLRKKDYRSAFELLTQAQTLSPLNPDRAMLLAKLHILWSIEDIRRMLDFEPRNTDLHFGLGKLLAYQGDYAAALEELRNTPFPANFSYRKELEALIQYVSRATGLA